MWLFYMHIFRDALMSLFDTCFGKHPFGYLLPTFFGNAFTCLFVMYIFWEHVHAIM